jgi:hypothetical protein
MNERKASFYIMATAVGMVVIFATIGWLDKIGVLDRLFNFLHIP